MKEAKKAFLSAAKVSRGSDGTIAAELKQLIHAGRTFAYEVDLEKKIEALTAEEVSAAFKKYIDPANLVIVEAGDFKKKGPSEK